MKSLALFLLVFLAAGCGNAEFTHDEVGVSESKAKAATTGIHLIVHNRLPEETISGKNVKPKLNAFFCAPLNHKDEARKIEDCKKLTGTIDNGATTHFLISKEIVEEYTHKSEGKGTFEFYDDHQLTSAPASCWKKHSLDLDPADQKQTWEITVNQRHSVFYGCIVNKK